MGNRSPFVTKIAHYAMSQNIVCSNYSLCQTSSGLGAAVEQRLEQINRMPEKNRAEVLEREARKEGELVWYAAMASDRAAELIKAFEGKYPFLKIRFQPGGAGRQLNNYWSSIAPRSNARISSTRAALTSASWPKPAR